MLKFSAVNLCLCFTVVAVNFWDVDCITEEEKLAIIEALKPIVEECASNWGLTEVDYKKHKKSDDIDPYFKKCMLQKLGILDEAGKYNRDAVQDSISKYTGDQDKAEKIQEQLDSCFDTDGDNDGDDEEAQMKRVDTIFKCLKEINE